MNLWEAIIYSAIGHGERGRPFIALLNAPTNEAWIDPWVRYLRSLGVEFRVGHRVEALHLRQGHIDEATVRVGSHGRRYTARAEWYICATPVERARALLSRSILQADPQLGALHEIPTRWMSGIQFFLRREAEINRGHVAYLDSPWHVSSVSQAQFWRGRDFSRTYGNGEVRDCVSAIVSEWNKPGILYGKAARDCRRGEIAREVWAQIQSHLEDTGREFLSDADLHSWFIDPAIRPSSHDNKARSDEPLFIETPGLWERRPEATTQIPNFFLASDYVRNRSPVDAATMDGANAAARAAVNGLLAASDSRSEGVPLYERYTAPEFDAAKRIDAARFRRGQPHLLDAD